MLRRRLGTALRFATPLPESPDRWLVLCEMNGVVVDPSTVIDTTDFFERLASAHGGEYDGWEASV